VRLHSEGYVPAEIQLGQYEPDPAEEGARRQFCAVLPQICPPWPAVGGFDAYTTSNVLGGSGLSSSAPSRWRWATSFPACLAAQRCHHHCADRPGGREPFLWQPCGLLDQTASSVGGMIEVDFENPSQPVVEKIDF
jgi:galactokinase